MKPENNAIAFVGTIGIILSCGIAFGHNGAMIGLLSIVFTILGGVVGYKYKKRDSDKHGIS